jgi:DNA-binding NarL/FixJ family response regulator
MLLPSNSPLGKQVRRFLQDLNEDPIRNDGLNLNTPLHFTKEQTRLLLRLARKNNEQVEDTIQNLLAYVLDTIDPDSMMVLLNMNPDQVEAIQELAVAQNRFLEDLIQDLIATGLEDDSQKELVEQWNTLTERQQDAVGLAVLGCSNDEIADRMSISPRTVKDHLRDGGQKLGASTKGQLKLLLKGWDFGELDERLPPAST